MVAPSTPRNDPNIQIPDAVKKLAAQADAAFHAANGTAPADPATPPTSDAPVTPEVTPPPIAAAPEAPVAPAAPQDWEHAFKSMKGRHDSAQNNIRTMSEQMAALQAQVATLSARAEAASEVPAELRPESFLSAEDVTEYGAEFLDVVGKKAREIAAAETAEMKKELALLKGRVEGDNAEKSTRARNAMNTALDDNVPTWRQVNVAPEFHSWLALPDPMSGAIRHSLLSAAYEQNNTPRVAAIFNGFLAHEAASAPASAEPDHQAPVADKIPLESLAAPGRAKTAAASGAPVEKPIFSTAQVSTFYAESAAGKWRGREAEYNRIDAQIIEAGREGRVR